VKVVEVVLHFFLFLKRENQVHRELDAVPYDSQCRAYILRGREVDRVEEGEKLILCILKIF